MKFIFRIVLTTLFLSSISVYAVEFANGASLANVGSAKSLAILVINAFMSLMILNAVRVLANPEGQNKMGALIYKLFVPIVVIIVLTNW